MENRLFAFVSLKIDDHQLIDNIVLDLNRKPFPGNKKKQEFKLKKKQN
jgi:hypothetical protein